MTDENLKRAIFINSRIKEIDKFLEELRPDKPLAISCSQSPTIRIHADVAELTDGVSDNVRSAIVEAILDYRVKLQQIYDSI